SGEAFAEIFAEGEIKRGVTGQISTLVRPTGEPVFSICKTRAVIDVCRGIGPPGQRDVAAHVERVALVMVERAKSSNTCIADGAGTLQTSRNDAAAFRDLVGVGEVHLPATRDSRRAQREFPGTNLCPGNCDREKDVGGPDVVVVEKIRHVGFEG